MTSRPRCPRRSFAIGVAVLVAGACSSDPPSPPAAPEATVVRTPSSAPAAPGPTITASTTPTPVAVSLDDLDLRLEVVAEGFAAPTGVLGGPDGRTYVLEQAGHVRAFGGDGRVASFLDLRDRVTAPGDHGLLGLAFHPERAEVIVHYSGAGGRTTLSRFPVSDGTADAAAEEILLTLDQPASNHNGGQVAFGPDGTLYLGLGDGGGGNDEFDTARDPHDLHGTIVRIDVDAREDGLPYAIPDDNPFADGRFGAPEVWAFGLRNPWRFAFDGDTIYIADVGQSASEEIDVVAVEPRGYDFGWSVKEGRDCFEASRYPCDEDGLTDPVLTYPTRSGCAVIGGVVYRGERFPALDGHYLYGDYCAGFVRSFLFADGQATAQRDWTAMLGVVEQLVAFGTTASGEILVVSQDGRILELVPA